MVPAVVIGADAPYLMGSGPLSLATPGMSKTNNFSPRGGRTKKKRVESSMPDVTILYWRDIPAQVIVGKGRRAAKVQLPERFEQAIDRAAMKSGAAGTDDYLAEWRKGDPSLSDAAGSDQDVANAEVARLETAYDSAKIKELITNDGWA